MSSCDCYKGLDLTLRYAKLFRFTVNCSYILERQHVLFIYISLLSCVTFVRMQFLCRVRTIILNVLVLEVVSISKYP